MTMEVFKTNTRQKFVHTGSKMEIAVLVKM